MRLILRELPVNEALSDVVDDSVLKSAMNLHPPRVFPSPHAYTLGVPRLILAMGIPSGEVHIVHATIVERRSFGLMALTRSQAGSHVADAHNGKFAQFTTVDGIAHDTMIPCILQVHVDTAHDGSLFYKLHCLPFTFNGISNRLLGNDMFSRSNSFSDLP